LITFHGTVWLDHLILEAAENVLGVFRRTLDRSDLLIVSVAYPQENKLMGDGLREAEAALLWVKSRLGAEHGIPVRRIFLAGHSQGGYIVTRLNTMHPTDGVVANAPGPLDVEFRCQLEERGEVGRTPLCDLMRSRFGTTAEAPQPYIERSLLSFTRDFTSDILFVQGLNDGAIQLRSWPMFQAEVDACETCADAEFLNLPGAGHDALFTSPQARIAFNNFLNARR
jgi:pimeloyl-ACP methyl ester carboxylesterase